MPEPFFPELRGKQRPRVMELGTRRSVPDHATHHKSRIPNAEWVLVDFQPGLDVDVVADAHSLTAVFPAAHFDGVLAVATFEHIQRPWIAAKEIAAVLKPGGLAYIDTHQTFPLHGYPSDYFRFSAEGLRTIFEDAGMETVMTRYRDRCHILGFQSRDAILRARAPAYIHTEILARKPGAPNG